MAKLFLDFVKQLGEDVNALGTYAKQIAGVDEIPNGGALQYGQFPAQGVAAPAPQAYSQPAPPQLPPTQFPLGMAANPKTALTGWDDLVSGYRDLGLSDDALYGALGNIAIESGGDPLAYNAKENAVGLLQVRGDRLEKLKEIAASMGTSIWDKDAQIAHHLWELQNTEAGAYDAIAAATSPEAAAEVFDTQYERSSGSTIEKRKAIAAALAAGVPYEEAVRRAGGIPDSEQFQTSTMGGEPPMDEGAPDMSPAAQAKRKRGMIAQALGVGLSQMSSGQPVDLSSVIDAHVARQTEMRDRIAEIAAERRRQAERLEERGWEVSDTATAAMLAERAAVAEDTRMRGRMSHQADLNETAADKAVIRSDAEKAKADAQAAERTGIVMGALGPGYEALAPILPNLGENGLTMATSLLTNQLATAADDLAANKAISTAQAVAQKVDPATAEIMSVLSDTGVAGAALAQPLLTYAMTASQEAAQRRAQMVPVVESMRVYASNPNHPNAAKVGALADLIEKSDYRYDLEQARLAVFGSDKGYVTAEEQGNLDARKATEAVVKTNIDSFLAGPVAAAREEAASARNLSGPLSMLSIALNDPKLTTGKITQFFYDTNIAPVMSALGLTPEEYDATTSMAMLEAATMQTLGTYKLSGPQSNFDAQNLIKSTVSSGKPMDANRLIAQTMRLGANLDIIYADEAEKWALNKQNFETGSKTFNEHWNELTKSGAVPQPMYFLPEGNDAAAMNLIDAYDSGWVQQGDLVPLMGEDGKQVEFSKESDFFVVTPESIAALRKTIGE